MLILHIIIVHFNTFFSLSLERNISSINVESVTYTQIRKVTFDEDKTAPLAKTDKVIVPNPALVVS